jgi:hypothetical protein
LWRIATPAFDVVVVDEAVSVMLHFESPLMARAAENVRRLEGHVRECGSLYVVDAEADLPFLRSIVGHFESLKGAAAVWVRNRHVRPTNRTAVVGKKPRGTAGLDAICARVRAGSRVVVCSSTRKFVLELAARAKVMCPRANVVLHHGDSDAEQLDDVAGLWATADLLAYSPSVTAGVSFELPHFDCLYANFVCCKFTPGVDKSLQQLFRVRQLSAGDMTIWYSAFWQRGAPPEPRTVADPRFVGLNPRVAGAVDHATPLGRLVADGVLRMRARSNFEYKTILVDTLRHDYGIDVVDDLQD